MAAIPMAMSGQNLNMMHPPSAAAEFYTGHDAIWLRQMQYWTNMNPM
jgi:hypothetical protein